MIRASCYTLITHIKGRYNTGGRDCGNTGDITGTTGCCGAWGCC